MFRSLFLASATCLIASPQAFAQPDRQQELLKRFPQADLNKDGTLTREEFRKFREQQRDQRQAQPKSPIKRYPLQDMLAKYEAREFKGVPYRLLKPLGFDAKADRKYPLILSLHGAGGKGNDNRKSLKVWNGVLMEEAFQKEHPCFVVAPQSEVAWRVPGSVPELTEKQIAEFPEVWRKIASGRRGFLQQQPGGVLDKVFDLLDEMEKEFPIDADRVYVLGHSMGGFGTFECLAVRPKRFAAAIPSAGGLAPWHDPAKFAHVPVWAFHGDADPTVPVGLTRVVFDAMKKAGGDMKFTSLAKVGHGANAFAFVYTGDDMAEGFQTHYSSDRCDQTADVWDWLFAQKRE